MNKTALGLALFAIVSPAKALNLLPDGINASYGRYLPVVSGRKADFNNVRLGLVWDWDTNLLPSERVRLDGYFELAGSFWKSGLSASDNPSPDGKDKAYVFSVSPVFRLSPVNPVWGSTKPFFDAGVGAAWLSEVDLEKELKSSINMGGHWQFEIRLMAGLLFGKRQQYEVSYGWMHYSNAHINKQNESIDFHMLTFGWRW